MPEPDLPAVPEAPAPAALTDFQAQSRGRTRFWVDPRYSEAVRSLALPERDLVAWVAEIGGGQGRGATAVLPLEGHRERLHLRPCRHGGLLGAWLGERWLGMRRARQELDVTLRLHRRGAPVPRPVLVVGQRRGPLWRTAVGTIHFEDAQDGIARLDSDPDEAALLATASSAGRAVRRFHDAGGWHADLHLKNLMFDRDGRRAWIIDLDRARTDPIPDPARRMHELGRLTRSLHKRGVYRRIGHAGRSAFFDAYVDGDDALARALLSHWPKQRRSIARHVSRYTDPG